MVITKLNNHEMGLRGFEPRYDPKWTCLITSSPRADNNQVIKKYINSVSCNIL